MKRQSFCGKTEKAGSPEAGVRDGATMPDESEGSEAEERTSFSAGTFERPW
jgi:hypothetical protein